MGEKLWLPHLRLQFGGTIGTPAVEEWSCSVRFGTGGSSEEPDELSPGDIDIALGGLVAPLRTWFTSAQSSIHQDAHLTFAKLNWVNGSGRQRDLNTHRVDIANANGANGTPQGPQWYQTFALTMRTALSRGRAHAGRIFPPLVYGTPEPGTPYLPKAAADAMAGNWAKALTDMSNGMFSAFSGDIAHLFHPIVAAVGETASGPNSFGVTPINQRITGVVVDRVADVQHRRTRSVPRLEGNLVPVNLPG